MSRLLIVDDDPGLATALRLLFEHAGYEVTLESDGRGALRAVHVDRPDLVLLDVGLPSMDGWTALERIREISDVPVIVLSVRGRQRDKVRGLRTGADDYVTKPFGNAELLARVEAILRRSPARSVASPDAYDDGVLRVDPDRTHVRLDGRDVTVTPTEFRLLNALVSRAGTVLTPAQLLEAAWDDASGYRPQRVKFAVLRLRRKLGWDGGGSRLETVRGFGYRYRPP